MLIAVVWGAGVTGGCLQAGSEVALPKSSLGGQVVISGGVRGARVRVDRLDEHGEVQHPLGEAVTDEAGRFTIETGLESGIFRIAARGGAYRDLATGATIQLDDRDEIVSLTRFELLAFRDDALVSPIGHMIEARTMERLGAGGGLSFTFDEARASFHRHFGDVDWGQVIPWSLDQPVVSPTEPVRAAFVLAALSVLARDIAADAQAGPQEITVYRLMEQWTEDVRAGPFDGNDGDERAPGSGLQLGFCSPVEPSCVPGTGCATGHCRSGCDLYSGTPRTLLAGAMIKVIGDTALNRTGLDLANTVSLVRGVSDNADPALFAASCRETPALSFQPSTVRDEDAEAVTFAADHSPHHAHTGMPIDLTTPIGCPALTKFSHLLGSTGPEYVVEDPGRNPILYQLVVDDRGTGLVPGSTQYRVGRRVGPQTIWVLDWTSAGTGEPIEAGVTRFPVGIYADVVPGLATTEGTYDVELRTTDRLGRTATAARCFELRLRAPPLDFESMGSQPTRVHAYALDSLSLAPGAAFDQIGARLLNDPETGTGASLLDQDIFNGTTSTVYLTATVTPPSSVLAAQSFVVANAPTALETPTSTTPASKVPEDSGSGATPMTTLHFPVRVFELVGGVPAAEIPCLAPCPPSGTAFRFAIPPRPSGGRPARAFRVMTMIGQVSGLWPRKHANEAAPPFEDTAITWQVGTAPTTTRLTGIVDRSHVPSRTGCVSFEYVMGVPDVCLQRGTLVPYRALASASLTFSGNTSTRYATAATASLVPDFVTQRARASTQGWATAEGTLPKDLLQ